MDTGKFACKNLECRTVFKHASTKCYKCGGDITSISSKARPPKQTASKKTWNLFWFKFGWWLSQSEKGQLELPYQNVMKIPPSAFKKTPSPFAKLSNATRWKNYHDRKHLMEGNSNAKISR